MEKEFIPYGLALKLKELGYKEECLASYYHVGRKLDMCEYINHSEYTILAPLWQQAFDFFREKHYLYCAITSSTMMIDWTYYIFRSANSKPLENPILEGWTYEEARLACLEKLIELIKEK